MAAYRVKMSRLLAPHRYTESTGMVADHNTPDNELAVNERGAPKQAFRVLYENDIIYSDGASFDSVSEADRKRASELLYVPNERYINDHLRLGSIEELEGEQAVAASSGDDDSGANYEAMTKAELYEEASSRGLDVKQNDSKAALVAALEEDDNS